MQEEDESGSSFLDGLISQETRRRTREQTQPLVDICCSSACFRSTILTVGSALLILTVLLVGISLSQTAAFIEDPIPDEFITAPLWLLDQLDRTSMSTHLQFLSGDLLEGRGVGTRGEELAVQYIATHFATAGLAPANNGSYFQEVPLCGHTPDPLTPLSLGPLSFTYRYNFTADSDHSNTVVNISAAEMVFVGYGINSSSWSWDDYKTQDVSGKIVVVLVNDPPATESEPDLFGGVAITYYGQWTYKFEEARNHGALGCLLIHTPESAGYDWGVVQNSFTDVEQVAPRDAPVNPLSYKGWMTEAASQQLAALHNTTLLAWMELASSRYFKPILLTTSFTLSVQYNLRLFNGKNVVGRFGAESDETIIIMAHHDHLGMVTGSVRNETDRIYNGAVDNASGVAAMLSVAYCFGYLLHAPPIVAPGLLPATLSRSLLFVSLTAEEAGLLGAYYITRHPPGNYSMGSTVAALNLDIMNVWGKTTDLVMVGMGGSSALDDLITRAAAEEGLSISPDPILQQGHFFRGDQLPFALKHIPAVNFATGLQFSPASPARYQNVTDYFSNRYHTPTDEYQDWSLGGAIQQIRVAVRLAYRLANSDVKPQYDTSQVIP